MKIMNYEIEKHRITQGVMGSDASYGNNGVFQISRESGTLNIIASDGMGWEHVSVSLEDRTPTWDEMCFIKDLFWNVDETVIQYHPKKSEYINKHPFCLHLWKRVDSDYELPPKEMIG